MDWQERNCFAGKGCVNWRDKDDGRGPGCAVWDAHILFSYEACNDKLGRGILDVLIPTEDIYPGACAMKLERTDEASRQAGTRQEVT